MLCKIAICDDNTFIISYIRKLMMKAQDVFSIQTVFFEFTSGEDLLKECEKEGFDLAVIDLSLGENRMNGLETAFRIREYNDRIMIVFCSGYDITPELLEVSPFRFIQKSMPEETMLMNFNAIYSELQKRNKNRDFYLKGTNEIVKVFIRDIVLVEGTKKGCRLWIKNEETKEYNAVNVKDSLETIVDDHPEFLRVKKSYAVNMDRVEYKMGMDLYLSGGYQLSVSRKYRDEFKKGFIKSKYYN